MGAAAKIFDKPKTPEPPPPPPEPKPEETVPKITDKEVTSARDQVKKRAVSAQGREDDIVTSPLGLPSRFAHGRQSLLGRA